MTDLRDKSNEARAREILCHYWDTLPEYLPKDLLPIVVQMLNDVERRGFKAGMKRAAEIAKNVESYKDDHDRAVAQKLGTDYPSESTVIIDAIQAEAERAENERQP